MDVTKLLFMSIFVTIVMLKITKQLALGALRRKWTLLPCSARTGEGLQDGVLCKHICIDFRCFNNIAPVVALGWLVEQLQGK